MRKENLFSKRGTAVLDRDEPDGTPSDFYRPSTPSSGSFAKRISTGRSRPVAVDFPEDADNGESGEFLRSNRRVKVRRGLVPEGRLARIAMGAAALLVAGAGLAAMLQVRSFLLHDPRFRIESSTSVQILGNSHVTRPELLNTFGEDIGRNIFYVPLATRRADLEALPWVAHATVMRLLPNRLRVSVVERTPVAFVRQGAHIGLVDASGVLLDMPVDGAGPHYSFPVLVGIRANEPLSTRAARMKIYQRFAADLDATGEKVSEKLSEVDLSDPEDVTALIPDENVDILVHFGDQEFLTRYHSYEAHLPEWKQQYPRLGSVDMRYEQQIVLEMQPGSTIPGSSGQNAPTAAKPVDIAAANADVAKTKPAVTPANHSAKKTAAKSTVVVRDTKEHAAAKAPMTAPAPPPAKMAAAAPAKVIPTGQSVSTAVKGKPAVQGKPAATITATGTVAKAGVAANSGATASASATAAATPPAVAKAVTLQGSPAASHPLPQPPAIVKLTPGAKPGPVLKSSPQPASTPAAPRNSSYHWTPLPAGKHSSAHATKSSQKQPVKSHAVHTQVAKQQPASHQPASQPTRRAQ